MDGIRHDKVTQGLYWNRSRLHGCSCGAVSINGGKAGQPEIDQAHRQTAGSPPPASIPLEGWHGQAGVQLWLSRLATDPPRAAQVSGQVTPAIRFLNSRAIEAGGNPPGAFCIAVDSERKPAVIRAICPGCGDWLGMTLGGTGWKWDGDRQRPTLSPSILHNKKHGGCGWHGFLTAGEFKECGL